MIYIETDNTAVTFVHYQPFDEKYGLHRSTEELMASGYLLDIDDLPIIEKEKIPTGKDPTLCYSDGNFYWKFENVITPKQDSLEQRLTTAEAKLDYIAMMTEVL